MTPRSPKLPPFESTNPTPPVGLPLTPPATQGHDFNLQAIFSIHGKTEAIEQKFSNVETRLVKVEEKLDTIIADVRTAKVIVSIFGVVLSAMGAVGLVFLTKILDIAVEHYKIAH